MSQIEILERRIATQQDARRVRNSLLQQLEREFAKFYTPPCLHLYIRQIKTLQKEKVWELLEEDKIRIQSLNPEEYCIVVFPYREGEKEKKMSYFEYILNFRPSDPFKEHFVGTAILVPIIYALLRES